MEEEFNIETLLGWASYYPEFEEKFVETFNSKESFEVTLKLMINVNDYIEKSYDYDEGEFERYNYEDMIRDLGIKFGIYENEEEFEDDYYDEDYIEVSFFNFYKRLEKYYTEFYEKLKEKGLTDKQIYDDAFKPSGKYGIDYDFVKLAKKHNLYEYFYNKNIKKW